jgi:hypothetical protein
MHRARAFFYVCAGLFLLALTYHLGARSAGAQAPAIEGANYDGTNATGVVGRTFHWGNGGGPGCGPFQQFQIATPIPGTSPVVATVAQIGCLGTSNRVLLENGDCYGSDGGAWLYLGNMLGAATPAARESFGALKSRYRGERGAQPTQNR